MSAGPGAVTVRRATPADAPAYVRLMEDPAVYPDVLQLPYPSEAVWRERLSVAEPGSVDLPLVALRDGQVVGAAGLHGNGGNVRRRHAASLGMTVAGPAQGQGVGKALMQALCDYADHWAVLLRLELVVYSGNARAIGLYEKFGFVVEGTLRGYGVRAGQYVDALAMARLHPSPPLPGARR